ncbi:MAG: efflux RND transporter periplasmic adaptor subunit [Planctomycetota bacterium]
MVRTFQSLLIFLAGVTVTVAILSGSGVWQPPPTGTPSVSTLPLSTPSASTLPGSTVAPVTPDSFASPASQDSPNTTATPPTTVSWPLELTGITEPGYGRFAKLPLATNQPVAFVDVKPGDEVEKGWQVFSHWESPDRLQAVKNDVERTKKQSQIAQTRVAAAEQSLARLETLTGHVPPQELQDAQTLVAIRRAEADAAELSVQEADNRFTALDFEFKQAFVTSPIDGIVVSVNVVQGERRQASESFRGVTILDPTVLNCRCVVTPRQAQWLRQPQATPPLIVVFDQEQTWSAKLVHVGVMAEGSTGLVPVIFEIPNPDRHLLCGIPVKVRLDSPTNQLASPVTDLK